MRVHEPSLADCRDQLVRTFEAYLTKLEEESKAALNSYTLVSRSKAAELLGYKSTTVIPRMINEGDLDEVGDKITMASIKRYIQSKRRSKTGGRRASMK